MEYFSLAGGHVPNRLNVWVTIAKKLENTVLDHCCVISISIVIS